MTVSTSRRRLLLLSIYRRSSALAEKLSLTVSFHEGLLKRGSLRVGGN